MLNRQPLIINNLKKPAIAQEEIQYASGGEVINKSLFNSYHKIEGFKDE